MAKKDVKEITEKLQAGVAELFESERYKEYLKFCSKFHRYSASNCLLIMMQMPTATAVAGYKAWQTKFGRQVRKGEKGITILAPCPHKKTIENEDGDEEEICWTTFRATTVFDISQTDGDAIPELVFDLSDDGDVYEAIIAGVEKIAPVPVEFKDIDGTCHGYYDGIEKRIAVANGMSRAQTAKTMIHEIAHALLHDKEHGSDSKKDRNDREVQAESVAYTVCSYFGIDSSEYSFGYIAGWSKGRDVKELCGMMDTVRKTSDMIIHAVEDGEKLAYVVTDKKKSA